MENDTIGKRNPYTDKTEHFSAGEFMTPGEAFRPVYSWEWNGEVSREETDRQLLEMQRLGIKAMYILPLPKSFRPGRIPSMMEPDYLTPAYMEEYRYAIEKAKELGMICWLYDEGGWPSGGACGKVLSKHPHLAQQRLACRKYSMATGQTYHAAEDALGAFYQNGDPVENGKVMSANAEITEYFIERIFEKRQGAIYASDPTREEATDAFIEITHEAYKPYLREHFGDTIKAVFFDEPAAAVPAYRKDLEERFEKENGYSVRPFLPELLGEKAVTKEGAKARIAWFDMTSRLLCENFLLREKKWANAHGMAYTGHMDGDDRAAGIAFGTVPVMRALRCLDIPGVDAIWRQIFPAEKETPFNHVTGVTCQNRVFPRYASSAAVQTGARRVMTESFAVYGAGLTFDEMRYVLTFQAVRGVNLYNLMLIPYAREGFLMAGELPFFTEKHACCQDLKYFNRYLERLSYVASVGKAVSHTALYIPFRDFFAGEEKEKREASFEKTAGALEDAHTAFDIFDDDLLKKADPKELAAGKLCMGEACYTTLVVPPCDYMPEESVEKLETFIKGGGCVLQLKDKSLTEIAGAEVVDSIENAVCPVLKLDGETDKVRLGERKADNGTIYLLNNESTIARSFTVEIKENAVLLDLENGHILQPERDGSRIPLTLLSGQMACLFVPDGMCEGEKESTWGEKKPLDVSFTFRRTSRFVIGDMEYETVACREKDKPADLGDWSGMAGIEYSGSGIYTARFAAPADRGKMLFDLGKVCCSCEVFLNGKSLGVRVMPPYSFVADCGELQKENLLEIRVTNTAANAYKYTKSFEKWPRWMLTSYWGKLEIFHTDSLAGGLYGPVTWRIEKQS